MEGDFYIDDSTGQTPEEWFVTTRRNRKSPRISKDLNRLNKCLKEMCLEIDFSLIRNKGSATTKKAPTKKRKLAEQRALARKRALAKKRSLAKKKSVNNNKYIEGNKYTK
jgi:hypothetical protein